jgi:hypothetical protein
MAAGRPYRFASAGPLFGEAASLLPLVRLLQLASPDAPDRAYSYSQGLEWAVEVEEVSDASTAVRVDR